MAGKADLKKHAELFDRMGTALGLDLQEEAIAGRLAWDEIPEAVLRCSRCARPGECQNWLAGAPAKAAAAPNYCRNRDLLAFLQEQQPE